MTSCLDSWAVLAWLDDDQPASNHVEEAMDDQPPSGGLPCLVQDLRS